MLSLAPMTCLVPFGPLTNRAGVPLTPAFAAAELSEVSCESSAGSFWSVFQVLTFSLGICLAKFSNQVELT